MHVAYAFTFETLKVIFMICILWTSIRINVKLNDILQALRALNPKQASKDPNEEVFVSLLNN